MATWYNSVEKPPKTTTQYRVVEKLGGTPYIARYNGPDLQWTIISFPDGANPSYQPKFYLAQ